MTALISKTGSLISSRADPNLAPETGKREHTAREKHFFPNGRKPPRSKEPVMLEILSAPQEERSRQSRLFPKKEAERFEFEDIVEVVGKAYKVSRDTVESSMIARAASEARHRVYYLAQRFTDMDYAQVAEVMKKSESSVKAGVNKITRAVTEQPRERKWIRRLIALLRTRSSPSA
jgi:hypothetical protein